MFYKLVLLYMLYSDFFLGFLNCFLLMLILLGGKCKLNLELMLFIFFFDLAVSSDLFMELKSWRFSVVLVMCLVVRIFFKYRFL